MRRRTLLGIGVTAVAGSMASCSRDRAASPWRHFTASEGRTLEAVCAQLIPADQDPGAREAGVANYIDLQLTKPFKRYRKAYRQGLAEIDSAARSQFGKPFSDLSSDQQVAVLKATDEKDRAFFELLLNHTRQGFYGDPRHGGNRGRVSWKMLGLPYPQVRGRQHYDPPKAG
jgi:gluconate 2-dehydrogenase gamma chain